MARQAPDPTEVRHDGAAGPLFEPPRLRELAHVSDPHTSVKAAALALRDGAARHDAIYLLDLIVRAPGATLVDHGATATRERGGDPLAWRLKLGRRTGTLRDRRLAHSRGETDGFSRYWPGRDPETPA